MSQNKDPVRILEDFISSVRFIGRRGADAAHGSVVRCIIDAQKQGDSRLIFDHLVRNCFSHISSEDHSQAIRETLIAINIFAMSWYKYNTEKRLLLRIDPVSLEFSLEDPGL